MLILSCILLWLLLLYTPTKTKEILFVIFFSIENQRIILFFCSEILVGIIIFTGILRNHTGLGRTRHFVTPLWFLKYFMNVSFISMCS